MPGPAAVSVTGLTKRFGAAAAVQDLSFSVAAHHVVGFLGPNGAGKTTTMRMLVGLSKPTSGQIAVGGRPVRFGADRSGAKVGYLPELPSLYGWMTAAEYLGLMVDLYRLPARERKIKELLALTGLSAAAQKRVAAFSGGMRQRLGIAQALVGDPEVLILDEPVSALDPIGRKEVLGIIEGMRRTKTVIFSTHILSDVDRICDDVVVINRGRLVAAAPLAELKRRYAQPILTVELAGDPAPLLKRLREQPWLKRVEGEGTTLRIWLSEEAALDQNRPLRFFAEQDLPVLRYGQSLPEIEDLFVEMVGGGHG